MKKPISLLLIAALSLGLLTGCQPDNNVDPPVIDEQQIKADYLAPFYPTPDDLTLRIVWRSEDVLALYIDNRYVRYSKEERIVSVEGFEFLFPDSRGLRIYSDGEFYWLKDGYEKGAITKEDLESLHKDDTYKSTHFLNVTPTEEQKIKTGFLALYPPSKLTAEDLTLRSVWRNEAVLALYIDSRYGMYTDAVRIVTIEGIKFWFPNSQELLIYHDGLFYSLQEAYEEGLITKEDLQCMQKDYAYINLSPESDFWDPTFDKDSIFPELVPSTG